MSATAAQVRAKMGLSETDWPDTTLEGDNFLTLSAVWIEERLDACDVTLTDLTANEQVFLDQGECCFVCSLVCEYMADQAAMQGSELKAGPVTVKGITPEKWRDRAKRYVDEAARWLGNVGVTLDTDAWGYEFRGGEFGKRSSGDYYTVPDRYPMLDPEHNTL